jgi:uncharacterized protein YcbK (DUF882 family)
MLAIKSEGEPRAVLHVECEAQDLKIGDINLVYQTLKKKFA